MQNRESWSCYESKVKKKSFFLSLTIHFIGITFLTVSSININHKNEVFVVHLVNIPQIPEIRKEIFVEKHKKISKKKVKKLKMRENVQTSFNVDEYKNKLLSKIVVERSKLEKNKKVDIEEINIPSLHSSSLKLKNVKFLTDIPTWYISLLKSRIEENWKFKNIIGELSTLISFRIYRSGKITNLKIEKSSGYTPYDRSAILAVKSTSDIPPFPEEIKQNYLDIIIEFKKED